MPSRETRPVNVRGPLRAPLPPPPYVVDPSETDTTLELPPRLPIVVRRAVRIQPIARHDAGSTQELREEDILEEEISDDAIEPIAEPPQAWGSYNLNNAHSSLAPFAIDYRYANALDHGRRADSTFDIEPPEPIVVPKRHYGWAVVGMLSVLVGIVGGVAVRYAMIRTEAEPLPVPLPIAAAVIPEAPRAATRPGPVAPPVSAPKIAPLLSGPQSAKTAIPVVAFDSLPKARVGAIHGPSNRRMIVDGGFVHGASALVSCGKHTVRVMPGGSHVVDVPCGGDVDVR